MCSVDAPEPQVVEVDKPAFVRNPYLDEVGNDARSADALRRGRSSLVIPTGEGAVGFTSRGSSGSRSAAGNPNGNSRGPNRGSGGGSGGTGYYNAKPDSQKSRVWTGIRNTMLKSVAIT